MEGSPARKGVWGFLKQYVYISKEVIPSTEGRVLRVGEVHQAGDGASS